MRRALYYVVLLLACSNLFAGERISLSVRDGITQDFYYLPNAQAVATVVLFPGGGGRMKYTDDGELRRNNNFLVRSRDLFHAAGFNVAVFNAPSDYQSRSGMKGGFRSTAEHVADIAAVVDKLRSLSAVPVWLVGTSRGTESVANAAIRQPKLAVGIVLTSSMSEPNNNGDALPEMKLDEIRLPVLLTTHKDDACFVTTPAGTDYIARLLVNASDVTVRHFEGGREPESDDCQALSAHGYLGIENEVVTVISDYIRRHTGKP